jgi:hypothetical protein
LIAMPDLRAYLLGALPENDAARLEADYFQSPETLAALRQAETELVDDYWRGRLPEADRARFTAKYLQSPALRDIVETGRPPKSAPRWTWTWAAAAALLVMTAGAFWTLKPRPSEPAVLAIAIPPGVTKSAAALPAVTITSGVESLELRLEALSGAGLVRLVVLDVQGHRSVVFPSLPSQPQSGSWTIVTVPARSLTSGLYMAELLDAAGSVRSSHLFRVTRR